MDIENARRILNKRAAERELLQKQVLEISNRIGELSAEVDDHIEARNIVSGVAKLTQEGVKDYIETLVTTAIKAVFPRRDYKFLVQFDVKKNKTDVSLLVQEGDKEPYRPDEEQAGGIVDIISFALRVVMWSLQAERSRNILVLDEPFRFTGVLIGIAGQMLKEISQQLGIQIVMVTHSQELIDIADKAWEVEMVDGRSQVREIGGDSDVRLKRRKPNRVDTNTEKTEGSDTGMAGIRRRRTPK